MKNLPRALNSATRAERKLPTLLQNKSIKIGNSGLPVEMPVRKIEDENAMRYLLDENFNYQMIKDKIQITSNEMIRLHNIGKK